MKTIEYHGLLFDSVAELYRTIEPDGISYMCLRRRLAEGWDIDAAITTPVAAADVKPLQYEGVTYRTVMELYRAVSPKDMSYMCFRNRLAAGWDIDKAASTPVLAAWRRTFTVNGVTYDSLKALADAAGITYMAAVKWAQRGMSDHDIFFGSQKAPAITKPKDAPVPRGNPVTVLGTTYSNLQEAYDRIKPEITFNAARQRIRRGQSIEDAFLLTERLDGRSAKVQEQNLVIAGTRYTAIRASEVFGVSMSTIRDRKARGARDAQAVGLEPIAPGELKKQGEVYANRKPVKQESFTVAGVEYKSIRALARAFNLEYALVYNRLRTYGWAVERAVTEAPGEPVVVDGVTYRSAQAAWEHVGQTSFSLFSARRADGLDIKVCLGIDPLPARERYEFEGKTYSNLDELAVAHGLTAAQLSGRLKTMTIEEAVRYRPIHGRYTPAKFKADPELAARQAKLYFVRIQAKDGQLHKVGITTRTTHARFHRSTHEVIGLWNGRLELLYMVEQEILEEFSEFHYRAEQEFDGRTETFVFLPAEEAEVLKRVAEKLAARNIMQVESSSAEEPAQHGV